VLQTSLPVEWVRWGWLPAVAFVRAAAFVCFLPPSHTHPFPSLYSPQSVLGSRLCTTLQTLEVRSNNVSPGPHCPSQNPCQVIVKPQPKFLSSHCPAFASPLSSFRPTPVKLWSYAGTHPTPPPPFFSARSLRFTRALSRASTGGGGGGGWSIRADQVWHCHCRPDHLKPCPGGARSVVEFHRSRAWGAVGVPLFVDPCCVCVCAPRSFGCMTFPLPMLGMIDGLIWGWAGPYCGGTDKVHKHGQSAHSVQ
jgi:hypothetical protein